MVEENEEKAFNQKIIRIGTHNINGIKSNEEKIEQLAEFGSSNNLDIIGVVETNIGEEEGK